MIKKILTYLLFTVVIAATIFCEALSSKAVKNDRACLECKDMIIVNTDTTCFVSSASIKRLVEGSIGQIVGQKVEKIDLEEVESLLDKLPAIKKSQVWMDGDGVLNIRIDERTPVARINRKSERKYFADFDGVIFEAPYPYRDRFDIPTFQCSSEKDLPQAFKLYEAIQADKQLRNQLTSLEIDKEGVCAIKLKSTKEVFLVGEICGIDSKIEKIKTYLNIIKPAKDSKRYKTVNLAFDNQIICK